MPVVTPADLLLLHISTSKSAVISAIPTGGGRYPFPIVQLMQQVVVDRLLLAGEHLRAGDHLLFSAQYRSAISRHYYAMYHAARAIVYAENRGDDYERHNVLSRNLPSRLSDSATRESELTDARLLRNQADYDAYPLNETEWENDARSLAITAASFLQCCESFASTNGYI
ncbi:HEPN domain-containing protein [Streptomyces sp. B15]|uniref:HEPN domain-containing protein n=1 Tax=Streptomyces sp. B15 TaxID=1537797 RepID=UPI001B3963BF|nr:HEPN domain-containing protein [Streptomyces sp. B15]MBQ1118597.1 HEPN domain-containing protein [Streptomyces sp. B15]